jgi:ABC-type transport system involved in cytochrome c biogenesis permease component
VLRAARFLGFTALGLLAATLALMTVAGALMTELFADGVDVDGQFWGAVIFTGVAGTLCLVDVTALVVALRGRRLLAQYRRERDDWREVRQAQGSLLRPR